MEDLDQLVLKYALQNAVRYDGRADSGAVMGKVLAERPELRSRAREVNEVVKRIVQEVNGLALETQRGRLEELAPELLVRERIERGFELPPLRNVVESVVMRFAPNPSGPLHIGHSRVAVLNDEYVKRYTGRYINRFEDTHPDRVDPEAYDQIQEDLRWLGIECTETHYQSDRFEIYYSLARELLEKGHAYVCACEVEGWRALKERGAACVHRDAPLEDNLHLWDKMFDGSFSPTEASLVVKTDLRHPNPALRDFVALRIDDTPHPRVGDRYRVYPLMNFSVAIDDHLMDLTHVLRGKDHLNNTHRQLHIFGYFGWHPPEYIHYGRVRIEGPELKTSQMSKGIRDGSYAGWDDPRLGTLQAIARRGIRPEAVREYWIRAGISEVDVEFSWETLYSLNKDLVDAAARRYFFVADPVPLSIVGVDHLEARAPLHPGDKSLGFRTYRLDKPITVYVPLEDIRGATKIRLKDLCNVEIVAGVTAHYRGNDLSALKEGYKIVHWVPEESVPMTVFMPDGRRVRGLGETGLKSEPGNIVQLERFGFAKIESVDPEVSAVFAHR